MNENTYNIRTDGLDDHNDGISLNEVLNALTLIVRSGILDLGGRDDNGIGIISFNEDDHTLDVKLTRNVTANLPTEQLLPKCVNKTGVDIPDGKLVYISGSQGNRPKITLADASTYATSYKTIGMTTEAIPNNSEGFVCRLGYVRDIDTSAYAIGTELYLDTTAGGFTDTKPEASDGYNSVCVGMVMKQSDTEGIICVKITSLKEWFGDLDNGNYLYPDPKGIFVRKGEARVVNDLQFPISTGKVPASNFPSYEALTTNTRAYAFDVNDYIDLQANEPSHGTDFTDVGTWHAHVTNKLANSSGSSQYVKLELTVAYSSVDGTWTEAVFTGEMEIPDGTSALTKRILPLNNATFDMSNVDLGGQIQGVIKRITATGGTEYASSVFLTQVGLHTYEDQDGSRTVSSKL